LVAALILGNVLGGYAKEIWFYFFPFPNQKKRIDALQRLVINETQRADDLRAFAEGAALNTNRVKAELVLAGTRIAALEKSLRERDSETAELKARLARRGPSTPRTAPRRR
jgi:hypothetical protein